MTIMDMITQEELYDRRFCALFGELTKELMGDDSSTYEELGGYILSALAVTGVDADVIYSAFCGGVIEKTIRDVREVLRIEKDDKSKEVQKLREELSRIERELVAAINVAETLRGQKAAVLSLSDPRAQQTIKGGRKCPSLI